MTYDEYCATIIRMERNVEFNEKIHCPRVAARYRRETDSLKRQNKEYEERRMSFYGYTNKKKF